MRTLDEQQISNVSGGLYYEPIIDIYTPIDYVILDPFYPIDIFLPLDPYPYYYNCIYDPFFDIYIC